MWTSFYLIYKCVAFIRSSDGLLLIVSSSDGFCSIISFSKEELGKPFTDNTLVNAMETEESFVQEDNEEVLNTPNKETPKEEVKQAVDFSEPTKKRIQLVTLSSPKSKKNFNK